MDALSATSPSQMGPQMYAMKQATQTQEELVAKLLDGLQNQAESQTASKPNNQELGAKLDIKA